MDATLNLVSSIAPEVGSATGQLKNLSRETSSLSQLIFIAQGGSAIWVNVDPTLSTRDLPANSWFGPERPG